LGARADFRTAFVEAAFERETATNKVNLSLPGFREDSGKIFIPPTVRHVEKSLGNETILTRDPLPIEGYHPFLDLGTRLAYGANTPAYRYKRVRRGKRSKA
jgi:aspartate aminotransferase